MNQETGYDRARTIFGVVFVLSAALFLLGLLVSFVTAVRLSALSAPVPLLTPTATPSPMETPSATATPTQGPPTETTAIAAAPVTHVVQYGETLFAIARRYGVTPNAIAQANGINPNLIYAGQTLVIPSTPIPPGTPLTTPTASATAAPTRTPTVTPTASATPTATPTPERGILIETIDRLAQGQIIALAGTCLTAITTLIGLGGFVSTTFLAWQKDTRETRRLEREIKQIELEKARLELTQARRNLERPEEGQGR